MSTWEEQMAAKAAARRHASEQAEAQQRDRERERRRAAYAHLGPCPCPWQPCPFPPWDCEDWLWQGHREHFTEWRRTGRCPSCGQPLTAQEMAGHHCPNQVALAG